MYRNKDSDAEAKFIYQHTLETSNGVTITKSSGSSIAVSVGTEFGTKIFFTGTKKCVYPSANRFPTTFENEIRNSICVFCFPAISENEIQTSIFVFHFSTTLENGIPNSIFVFRRHRQLNFNFHFCCTSFYCFTKLMFQSVLWSFRSTARINIGTSFLREKAWKTMAIFWCE